MPGSGFGWAGRPPPSATTHLMVYHAPCAHSRSLASSACACAPPVVSAIALDHGRCGNAHLQPPPNHPWLRPATRRLVWHRIDRYDILQLAYDTSRTHAHVHVKYTEHTPMRGGHGRAHGPRCVSAAPRRRCRAWCAWILVRSSYTVVRTPGDVEYDEVTCVVCVRGVCASPAHALIIRDCK